MLNRDRLKIKEFGILSEMEFLGHDDFLLENKSRTYGAKTVTEVKVYYIHYKLFAKLLYDIPYLK